MGLKMVTPAHEKEKKASVLKTIPKKFWGLINWIAKGQPKTGIHCKA
jgi:hypothetical protein